jgi:hypothetical protein
LNDIQVMVTSRQGSGDVPRTALTDSATSSIVMIQVAPHVVRLLCLTKCLYSGVGELSEFAKIHGTFIAHVLGQCPVRPVSTHTDSTLRRL